MGLARALIRHIWLIVALRWSLCVVATPQNPSSPAHVASGHVRTRRRPGLASGGREVALHHHKVVAAAHIGTFVWPLSGCAQLGTAGTLGDRRPREAAVIGERSKRSTPVVVAGHGGEHARLGAEARKSTVSSLVTAFDARVGATSSSGFLTGPPTTCWSNEHIVEIVEIPSSSAYQCSSAARFKGEPMVGH
jgi:hypothetical protein